MPFSLVVLVGAFILIPGGCGLVFSFGGVHLVAVALAFAPLGASLLVTISKEVTLWALKFRFQAIFAEMPFLLTIETFVFATCLYSVNVHGIRVPCLGPFCRSFLNEIKKLLTRPCLSKIFLELMEGGVAALLQN